jgi:hypothetical protein
MIQCLLVLSVVFGGMTEEVGGAGPTIVNSSLVYLALMCMYSFDSPCVWDGLKFC